MREAVVEQTQRLTGFGEFVQFGVKKKLIFSKH